jgi:hypothetical protein
MRIVTLALCTSVFVASVSSCVGDEPAAQRPTVATDDGGLRDTGVTEAPDGQARKCNAPEQACPSGCVDTSSSVDNCGSCGRSCGGGTCTSGVCGVAVVRADIDALHNFAIDEQSLYFTSGNLVRSCKNNDCTGEPKQLASMGDPTLGIEVDSGVIYFESENPSGRPAILRCATAGCTTPIEVLYNGLSGIDGFLTSDSSIFYSTMGILKSKKCAMGSCTPQVDQIKQPFGFFTVDASRIYFTDTLTSPNALYSCQKSEAPCATRTPITVGPINVIGPMVVAQNNLFFVASPSSGQSLVRFCPVAGACANPGSFSKSTGIITTLAADARGIYWVDDDDLKMCADTNCLGTAKTVAIGVRGTTQLRLSSSYVYFAIPGAGVGAKGAIKRIAR